MTPPQLSLRAFAVWRRNFLVWRKLAIPSLLGNLADPMIYRVWYAAMKRSSANYFSV